MQKNYKSKEQIKKQYDDTKKWLEGNLDSPAEEMAAFFDARIEDYENVHMKHWLDVYRAIPDYLPKQFETLLDIGCGSGLEFDWIFKRFPNIQVTGIDLSTAMLNKFNEKHGDKNINLIQSDYFQYPFEQKQYDVIMSVQSLHHFMFEKKKDIYTKIYNALKPGCSYYEFDYMAQDEAYEQLNLEYYHKRRAKHNVGENQFVHIDLPLTVEHQIKLLKLAGFNKVEVLNRPFEKHNIVFLMAWKA